MLNERGTRMMYMRQMKLKQKKKRGKKDEEHRFPTRVQTNFKNSAEYRISAEIRLPFQPNRTQFSKIRFRFNRNRNTGKKFGFNRILTEFFITGIAVSCRKAPDMQA